MNFWLSFSYPVRDLKNIKHLKDDDVLIEKSSIVDNKKENVILYALVGANNNNPKNNADNAWDIIKENFPKYKSRFLRPINKFESLGSFIEDFILDNNGRIGYLKDTNALFDSSLINSQQKNKI